MTERTKPDDRVRVFEGDSREVLRTFPDNHFDSVVTDPPYALTSIVKRYGAEGAAPTKAKQTGAYSRTAAGFMGQRWDNGETAFDETFWAEVLRVLKPGGHLLAFGGTRTYGELQVAIGAAGFEVRDSILEVVCADTAVVEFMNSLDDEQLRAFVRAIEESQFGGLLAWVYGSGFPKSHDVALAFDKAAGVEREVIGQRDVGPDMTGDAYGRSDGGRRMADVTSGPVTDAAKEWDGWGTALKPAFEPIVVARKALIGSVIENVAEHRTGALNVGACEIPFAGADDESEAKTKNRHAEFESGPRQTKGIYNADDRARADYDPTGRFPANVLLDGSAQVLDAFPSTKAGAHPGTRLGIGYGGKQTGTTGPRVALDAGSSARFFYSSKADGDDRVARCPVCSTRWIGKRPCRCIDRETGDVAKAVGHPTVKPVDLKAYLTRLVTPPGGLVLDCFAGSGTTGMAALREGFRAVLIEREPVYVGDILHRLRHVSGDDTPLFGGRP